MDAKLEWFKRLTEVPGISGYEGRVKNVLKERLSGMADLSYDHIGSILFRKQGDQPSPKIMLATHMDEVGFMVKHITKEGFLKFTAIGGWWEQVMLGQRVTVLAKNQDIPGVIGSKPPHILTAEERKKVVQKKEMYIDVGAKDEQEVWEKMGIKPGDPVVPYSEFTVMANENMLMAKAWDNRVGCAIMAEVMEQLGKLSHPNTVYGAATAQEEVGLRGAQTSVAMVNPDLAFVIDTCVPGDTPGVTEDQATSKLGKGVAVSIYDSSMIPYIPLRDYVVETAEREKIPYQLEFTEGGGTDGGRIHVHNGGVPSLVLSIPTRYLHSHNSIIHRDDYEAAVRLLVAVLKKLDEKTYHKLLG